VTAARQRIDIHQITLVSFQTIPLIPPASVAGDGFSTLQQTVSGVPFAVVTDSAAGDSFSTLQQTGTGVPFPW